MACDRTWSVSPSLDEHLRPCWANGAGIRAYVAGRELDAGASESTESVTQSYK